MDPTEAAVVSTWEGMGTAGCQVAAAMLKAADAKA